MERPSLIPAGSSHLIFGLWLPSPFSSFTWWDWTPSSRCCTSFGRWIHRRFALLKVVFFPLYLPILCCRCCRGPAYATYIPSPPMFHVPYDPWFEPQNTFGEGWMWYHLGQEQGRREAYWDQNRYRSVPVYGPDDHYSSPSNDPSKHESTSYASTSRR